MPAPTPWSEPAQRAPRETDDELVERDGHAGSNDSEAWAVRSWERSLLLYTTRVGVWATVTGVNEIFAAFSVREADRQLKRIIE